MDNTTNILLNNKQKDNISASVIVPIYNAEKTLSRCLDSILESTLTNIEVICINDGSTDSSLEILEEYCKKDKRVKVITQENKGIAQTRNIGMSLATGEYTSFVDSDDCIEKDFLSNLYINAKKFRADIAIGSIVRIYGNGQHSYILDIKHIKSATKTKKKYKLAGIPENNYIWNKIYRTQALKNSDIKFNPGRYYEDIVFSCKVLHYMQNVITVPHAEYYYCTNSESITGFLSPQKEQDYLFAKKEAQRFLQEHRIHHCANKHWCYELIYDLKIFGLPILKIKKYGKYKLYKFLGIPFMLLRDSA